MTEMQKKLLDMFSWFHNFCKENNLKYIAIGGTALGAVRHKGFIPWDDDIDVGMPRKEYEKLKELSWKVNENGKYFIEFPSDKIDYVYTFGKIYDTETTLIENTRYKAKRGIYIDVFPIDGIGNSLSESIENFKKVQKKINLLRAMVVGIRKDRKFYKNMLVLFMRCVPRRIINSQNLIREIDMLSKLRDYDKSDYVVNYGGAWGEKEIMEKKWLKESILCKFENLEIYIPKGFDKYLTKMYGNYMQPPPMKKRTSHHNHLYINLDKSYLD